MKRLEYLIIMGISIVFTIRSQRRAEPDYLHLTPRLKIEYKNIS